MTDATVTPEPSGLTAFFQTWWKTALASLLSGLVGFLGSTTYQKATANPEPRQAATALSVTITAEELRKLTCGVPTPKKPAAREGNAFGTLTK